jgi:hypothetical protein
MRKQKPFPDDVVLQVQKMQAEGHLDHEIQEYLVRSGTLTEWDAEVLVHQLNASRGKNRSCVGIGSSLPYLMLLV